MLYKTLSYVPLNPLKGTFSCSGTRNPFLSKHKSPLGDLVVRTALLFALLFTTQITSAQNFFRSPLGIPLLLSGSFGELRGAHFHSGMDIKTQGHTGEKVYAPADGYISRIRVAAGGFGYALYVDHPNGYTTVYGHLQEYNATIAAFTKRLQYAKESFELDTMLGPNVLPVKKGDVIALSGNTGSSGGPHLHFEVRRKKDQVPMNPQLMGFDLKDNIPPDISELYIYPLDSTLADVPFSVKTVKVGKRFGVKDTIRVNGNQIGFGVHATDKMSDNPSIDDIFQLVLKVAGKTVYRFTLDSFSFDDTKYVQAHEDFRLKSEANKTIQRLYKLPGNFIQVYDSLVKDGMVTASARALQIEVIARDAAGNSSSLIFYVKKDANAKAFKPAAIDNNPLFKWNKDNRFKRDDIEVLVPEKNLYRDMHFHYDKKSAAAQKGAYSDIHLIHDPIEPLHKRMKLTIKAVNFPPNLKDKAVMAHRTRKGGIEAYDGTWKGNELVADVKEFGEYYISVDTVGPKISPMNISEGKDMSKDKKLQLKIGDGLSGAKTFRGSIDGKWILMEFDGKSGTLSHTFEKSLKEGEHQFKLIVTDRVNNTTELNLTFKRSSPP